MHELERRRLNGKAREGSNQVSRLPMGQTVSAIDARTRYGAGCSSRRCISIGDTSWSLRVMLASCSL
jgi:hypothetical protein